MQLINLHKKTMLVSEFFKPNDIIITSKFREEFVRAWFVGKSVEGECKPIERLPSKSQGVGGVSTLFTDFCSTSSRILIKSYQENLFVNGYRSDGVVVVVVVFMAAGGVS